MARTIHLLLAAALPVLSAEPVFKEAPRLVRRAGRTAVTFSLAGPGDVEVAVVDGKGRVVRHLAAGVLGGKNPPPPPLVRGLKQEIAWDGKDDTGKPVRGGCVLRVRAGMKVSFGRMIGGSPYTGTVDRMPYRARVNGLVADATGTLYVKMMSSIGSHGNSGLWPWHLRAFDTRGEYIKTLLPYPPSTPPDRAPGFTLISTPLSPFTPANRSSLYPVLYVFGNEIMSRMVNGYIVFVHTEKRELNLFKPDGSNELKTIRMWTRKKVKCPRWLDIQAAFSPDGRYVYYSNVAGTPYNGKKPSDIDPAWPQGRIYRQDLSKPGTDPEPFFDLSLPDWKEKKYWMPNAWNKKTAAAGIDTDARGNVLVCDLVNQEVVEISPAGKKLSATKVPWPEKVMVSRKTGALYVISRKVNGDKRHHPMLYKITGRGNAAVTAAQLQLKGSLGGGYTLDEHASPPVIWLAGGGKLVRVEDRGNALVVTGGNFLNRDAKAITFVGYMDVDPEADLVYVTGTNGTVWRFDGKTGTGGPVKIKAADLAVGPGGHVYTWGTTGRYHGPIARYTRDLRPAPLPATGKHVFGSLAGRHGRGESVSGMDVDIRGRVYVTNGVNACYVAVYGPDGKLVDFPRTRTVSGKRKRKVDIPVAVDYCSGYGGSIRVDLRGNIYLLQYGLPPGFKPPAGFERDPAWRACVGTILKFPPGGATRKTPVKSGGRGGDPLAFDPVLALYPGCAPISSWNAVGSCACTKPRFEVDGFGRLYIPNAITFTVSVRDNAGNEIVRFGGYGNFDCGGPQSKEPRPEIPLGWPITVGASDAYIYVGDCLNHRVVRVDKSWAAERRLPL